MALRRPRDIVDPSMNIQNEISKPHSIQLRSKSNQKDQTRMKMSHAVNGRPFVTRLSRQQRGVMTDIGNNGNNLVKTNTTKKKLQSVHRSVVEEPRAKKEYCGETAVKPFKDTSKNHVEFEDVTMASADASEDVLPMILDTADVTMAEPKPSPGLLTLMNPVASQEKLEDVDKEDRNDPQMVSNYVNDIFTYLRGLESKYPVREGYLYGQKVIIPKMRAVLTDWMVEVHQQFTLLQETLYLSVAILDRYMQLQAKNITRKKLQLVGVTAMFIAAKYEEMYAPEIGDFVYITDNAYSESQIREQEVEMIKHLNFCFERPLPLHFLRRFSKVAQVDTTIHNLAKYLMELAIVEYKFCHIMPSKLAAAALAISVMAYENDPRNTLERLWSSKLAYYTQYTLSSIADLIQELAGHLLSVSRAKEPSLIMAVRKKYSNKKYIGVSVSPVVHGWNVTCLAEGRF